MTESPIRCPHCDWQEEGLAHWNCQACGGELDFFASLGRCPQCGEQHHYVACPAHAGGCDQVAPLLDWYPHDFDAVLHEINIIKE